MKKCGKLSKVTELQSNLVTSLQSSKNADILKEITSRIGSLSTPSKMPGYAWSIPAKYCITGNKLALVQGTPCSKCYALKNRYLMGPVQNAMEKRLKTWQEDPDWVLLMSIRLLLLPDAYFRWFDSGDLQSLKMLKDINQIAWNTNGFIAFWLPSQERGVVSQLTNIAPNLTIRISSTKIGEQQTTMIKDVCTSSIGNKETFTCPSSKQGNKCLECRACWDKQITNVVYLEH